MKRLALINIGTHRYLAHLAIAFSTLLMGTNAHAQERDEVEIIESFGDGVPLIERVSPSIIAEEIASVIDANPKEVMAVISQAKFQGRVVELMDAQPESVLTWAKYSQIVVDEARIKRGVDFYREHKATLRRAEREFGVDAEIIVAILGIETRYGSIQGGFKVNDVLATLAFEYPRRSRFFTSQYRAFLMLCFRHPKVDCLDTKGSPAGALGYAQFLPSNYTELAIDFNNDGVVDLFESPEDAIGSIAAFLKDKGYREGEPVMVPARPRVSVNSLSRRNMQQVVRLSSLGWVTKQQVLPDDTQVSLLMFSGNKGFEFFFGLNNTRALAGYNNSRLYVRSVMELAQQIALQI